MSRAVRQLVVRPPFPERLTPAQWRQLARVRLVLILVALAIDGALVVALRRSPSIDTSVLDTFALINIPILCASGVISIGMLRSPGFCRDWVLAVSAALEAFSIVVWVQATGTLTGYFLLAGAILLLFYRLYTSWAIAVVIGATLVVSHGAAIALEVAGVLRPEALFVGAPGTAYTVPSYQLISASSVAWIYVLSFVASNALVNKLREKDRALAELRREADRAARELKPGRLTGMVVAGEYALHELLGRGGMGEIYKARRISHDDDVALKVLHGHLSADDDLLERFRREAANAERVAGDHVARVLEIGSEPARDLHFIAMELLRGEDFGAYLRRRGTPAMDELLPIARGIAAALDAAHDTGVIHRDIKPQNIFLAESGGDAPRVVLLDFGLSKLQGPADPGLTATDALIGTVSYMAPEQATGAASVGAAADRYALAAVLYRALTGQLPLEGRGDLVSQLQQIVRGQPLPPTTIRPALPRQLDAVMAVGLAKNPDDRFATAAALVDAVEAAATSSLADDVVTRARRLASSLDVDPTLPG